MLKASLSPETENEIDRVFRDLEFFESRESEIVVVDGKLPKETTKKRMNKTASIDT